MFGDCCSGCAAASWILSLRSARGSWTLVYRGFKLNQEFLYGRCMVYAGGWTSEGDVRLPMYVAYVMSRAETV